MDYMAGQEVFTEVGTEGRGNVKVDLKEGATLSASGVKEPESRPSLHSEVCDAESGWQAPALGSPWPPPLLRKPAWGICTLGFTYLSDQPIFLSEAFANSLGTISYSGLVKDL